jgi:hypothetical protein
VLRLKELTKAEKKEQQIRENRTNVSIGEFESLILRYGEILGKGSHLKAYIGNHVYAYKRENPVKAFYVEGILKIIDELKDGE